MVNDVDQAMLMTSALVPGTQPLSAVYAGDGNFVGSPTATVLETVTNSTTT